MNKYTKGPTGHGSAILENGNELSTQDILDRLNKQLPDIYAGELNTKRIKAYLKLSEEYNMDELTIGRIFSKAIEWYKEFCRLNESEGESEQVVCKTCGADESHKVPHLSSDYRCSKCNDYWPSK